MNYFIWLEAARLRTLPASLVPVLLGSTLAWTHGQLNVIMSLMALLSASLIQVGTNYANDYFDHKKGADTPERAGFTRATASGLVLPATMMRAATGSFVLAFLSGMVLVFHAGWPILLIGLFSILAGFLYTGGPRPLAYNGLGEVFVFLFFGFAAVMGTYYVNALSWSAESALLAAAVGALSSMILVVNNYRDVHTDRKAGKNTLAVLFGERFSRWQFLLLMALAFLAPFVLFVYYSYALTIFVPYVLVPEALLLTHRFWTETDKPAFNKILGRTARFMTLFGVLMAAGIALG